MTSGVDYEISVKDNTSQGVDSAAKKVEDLAKKAGNTAEEASERIVKSVGQLPGILGKVQNALGGIAGKALAVIGAFKTGWDIGTWLQQRVIAPLLGLQDPIEELKKKNRELKKEAEVAAEKWAEAQDRLAASLEQDAEAANEAVAKIDRLAAAYIRLQEARKAVADAEADAEELSLQRDKFEDMLILGREGRPEQAAQIGKYYDVMIAERRKERTVGNADMAVEKAEVEIERGEKAIAELKKRERQAAKDYERAAKRTRDAENNVDLGEEQYKAQLKRAQTDEARALRNWTRLSNRRKDEESDMEARYTELTARQLERANAEERANQEIDAKKKAYDDYLDYVRELDEKEAQEEAQKAEENDRNRRDADERDRKQMEDRLHRSRMANTRAEVQERAQMEAAAQQRLAAAQSAVRQAWGWYRDKGSLKTQLAEEQADAAAQSQYEKDFEKLRFRRDWREAKNLSLDQEAVRRVALAREEEQAAQEYAKVTAEASQRAADALESIEAAVNEGGLE